MTNDKPQFAPAYKRSVATVTMLGLAFFAAIAAMLLNGLRYVSLSRLEVGNPLSEPQIIVIDGLFGLLELGQLLINVVCAIPFCAWFYQVYKNLLALGNPSLTYRAAWAAGSFFVPLLNLFRPPKIAKEIWHGSDPEGLDRERLNFTFDKDATIVSFWWALFLIAGILNNIGSNIFKNNDFGRMKSASIFFGLSDLALSGAAVMAISLVLEIRKRQADRYQRLQALSVEYAEQPPAGAGY